MFDAKDLLDKLIRGGGQSPGQQGGGDLGAIGDLLRQLGSGPDTSQSTERGTAPVPRQQVPQERDEEKDEEEDDDARTTGARGQMPPREQQQAPLPGGMGGLEEILRQVLGGGQRGVPGAAGGLGEILGKLQQGGQGGIADILKQVLGQATSGVREGAGRIDDATGASKYARDAIGQASGGRSPEELIAQLKELIASNKLGAGAALGGLGALILGTGAGRSLAASAIKMGGLALIGGLAYKAYQNYQQGRPMTGDPGAQQLLAAPEGSGFEASAVSNEQAMLYIRAMIAAAAADGRIDAAEQKKIMGGLQQAGIGDAAQAFLARELSNPASVEDLAGAVSSQEDAVQVFTAARVAVDVDTDEEHEFLTALAEALGIDEQLAAQVDAAARGASG